MNRLLIMTMLILGSFASTVLCPSARSQNYPSKPIRAIVPFAPGGGTDIAMRVIGQKLVERWGQQVIVDNRGGANGNIGAEIASRAAPDGYTLLVGSAGVMAINPSLYTKLPFDSVKDFTAVALVAPTYFLLVTHPSVPVNSVAELIQLAKGGSFKLVHASPGIGSPGHLSGEMLKMITNIDFITVPYKGTGPAMADVLGGQASFTFTDMIAGIPYINAKRLKVLGITTTKRISKLPDTPTVAEGGVPGFDAMSWIGIFVPARTPRPIVEKLNAEIRNSLKLPDVQEKLATDGNDFGENTPDRAEAFLKSEVAKWAKVIKISGARID